MKDLKLQSTTRDDIIFELRSKHSMNQKDAQAYYNEFHKGERGASFAAEFDDYAIEANETEVAAYIVENIEAGRINKSSGKSYYLNRAKLIARITALYA